MAKLLPIEDISNCDHLWVVFSTAICDSSLMLVCANCDAYATVDDHSSEEWRSAFYAPSIPYVWRGGTDRVVLRQLKIGNFLVNWEGVERAKGEHERTTS